MYPRKKTSMETYILHEVIEKHGGTFKFHWSNYGERRSQFSDILMIEGNVLRAISPGGRSFRRISKKVQKGLPLEDWEIDEIPSIKLEELKKVKYRPKFEMEIAFGIGDGYMYDTDVQLFRSVHADTNPKLSIDSLWLIEPEISKVIAPFVTASGVMTDFKQTGDFLTVRKTNKYRSFQDKLGRVYTSFKWDEEEAKWMFDS